MVADLLDGNSLSKKMLSDLKERVSDFKSRAKITPKLAIILVGKDNASEIYVSKKLKNAKAIGIDAELIRFDENVSEQKLIDKIQEMNSDEKVHGLIIQVPLPKHLDMQKVLNSVCPLKDVDGFTCWNLGLLLQDKESFIPATPLGIIRMLEHYKIPVEGKNVCMVGHSLIVGKPLALLFLNKNATVTICHKFTKNLSEFTKKADILCVAVGKQNLITAKMVKKNAVVIDIGINRLSNGKIVGDVDFEKVKKKASFITPVPGGVGPMTVYCLLKNTLKAAENLQNKK